MQGSFWAGITALRVKRNRMLAGVLARFFLPAVFGLHHLHQGTGSRAEKRGFRILVVGLLAAFIGVRERPEFKQMEAVI